MDALLALGQRPLEDFITDPILTVACVLLIIVAFLWILTARLIAHNQKAVERARARRRTRAGRPRTRPAAGSGPARAGRSDEAANTRAWKRPRG